MVFTDWYDDQDNMMENLGWSFNVVIACNLLVHIGFLIFTIVSEARTKCRRKQCFWQKCRQGKVKSLRDQQKDKKAVVDLDLESKEA